MLVFFEILSVVPFVANRPAQTSEQSGSGAEAVPNFLRTSREDQRRIWYDTPHTYRILNNEQ